VARQIRVLHIIEQLRPGGPLQALIAARKQSRLRGSIEHHIVSLGPADHRASAQAAAVGIADTGEPTAAALRELMIAADIVQVHFWNSPAIHTLLVGDLPPIRLCLWCHVNGAAAPHIIPRWLLERSDKVVATAASTLDLPAFRTPELPTAVLVQSTADFTRLSGLKLVPHDAFQVGYIGNIDFGKLHESFVSMCAAVDVPSVRFLIGGYGAAMQEVKHQAHKLGVSDRFEFHGYVEDVRPILAQLDVFGYPLTSDSFATAELSLQEAMYAGVAPIVFAVRGPNRIVANGKTGIVVASQSEYVSAIEWLYHNPNQRRILGKNAASYMRQNVKRRTCQSDAVYLQLIEHPKQPRGRILIDDFCKDSLTARLSRGACLFIRSLGGVGDADFRSSLLATAEIDAEAAELRIAQSSANMQHVILQYRLHNQNDPHLRLWAGLVLRQKQRPALAASEFHASIALGCDSPRVRRYLQESIAAAGRD